MTNKHDLTDHDGEAEALRKENERLRKELMAGRTARWAGSYRQLDAAIARAEAAEAALAELRAADPVVNTGDLISRAAAIKCCNDQLRNTAQLLSNPPKSSAAWDAANAIRALPAAPVAKTQPNTGAFPDRIVLYAKTDDFGVVGCAEDIWLDPVQDVVEISNRVKNQRAEIREYVPADSAPVAEAQPDWKAMAERLGEAIRVRRSARFASQLYGADEQIDAALSDLAKMKWE